MHMKECGRKTYLMVKVYITGKMVPFIRAILSQEYHMEEVRNHILVEISTMENGHMGRKEVQGR